MYTNRTLQRQGCLSVLKIMFIRYLFVPYVDYFFILIVCFEVWTLNKHNFKLPVLKPYAPFSPKPFK
jgi:hypothetical protein